MAVSFPNVGLAPFLTVVSAGNGTFGKSILAEKISSGDYFILSPEVEELLLIPSELTEYAPAHITEDCL